MHDAVPGAELIRQGKEWACSVQAGEDNYYHVEEEFAVDHDQSPLALRYGHFEASVVKHGRMCESISQ